MKILCIILLTIGLLIPHNTKADDGMILATALCGLTKIDNHMGMRKKLRRANVKLRRIYKGTTCNGMHLYTWARKNNAEGVMKFLKTKMKSRIADEL